MTDRSYLNHYRDGNFIDCEVECRRLIEKNPRDFNPNLVLCVSLTRLDRCKEAIEIGSIALDVVVATDDQKARLIHAIADALLQLDRLVEAIEYYRKSLSLVPKRPKGLFSLAEALYTNNEFGEAQKVFEELFRVDDVPNDIYPHALYTYSIVNSEIGLGELSARFPKLQKRVKHHLYCHAIGNFLSVDGQSKLAFQLYDEANNLRRLSEPYSFQTDMEIFDIHQRSIGGVSSIDLDKFPKSDATPIFIVGMPRTGSSLLEQMLGGHSSIAPTGETGWLMKALRKSLRVDSDSSAFLNGLQSLGDKEFLLRLRSSYFENVSDLGTEFFVDKTLGNFQLLWLVRVAFPEAIVIHSAREKGPTIWSCYKTSFRRGVRFSESLPEASVYFDKVEVLTRLWAGQLKSRMIRVQYEELIEDSEKMIREVLSTLDLQFESATLSPSSQSRIVNTASKVQVTKPIFKRPNREDEPFREFVEARIAQAD